MTTGAETGLIKTVISALLKPFEIVTTPIYERGLPENSGRGKRGTVEGERREGWSHCP